MCVERAGEAGEDVEDDRKDRHEAARLSLAKLLQVLCDVDLARHVRVIVLRFRGATNI